MSNPLLDAGLLSPDRPTVLFLFETDCPTCRLATPYLSRLAEAAGPVARVVGLSQDPEGPTASFAAQMGPKFEIRRDRDLAVSRHLDPGFVPAVYLIDPKGDIRQSEIGFAKVGLNQLAAALGLAPIADEFDGNPAVRPGCSSRHREGEGAGPSEALHIEARRASRLEVPGGADPWDFARELCGDPLPVVPPTPERVDRMLGGRNPEELVALIPPNYGAATMEKIAANAVMAGCAPEMMRVLAPLVRAVCDERFNIHGIQATTHFAAPLVVVNGPVRRELGFHSGGNVFSNVARANSTLGRALQLILVNLGGARPGEIDMSALGNPGKFSYVIAENEEENPWDPLQCDQGFSRDRSTVTLFAAAGLSGFSEHTARSAKTLAKAFAAMLATVWSPRVCNAAEAFVIICPEHARTIAREGFSKEDWRNYLFENTGIPVREYEEADGGEGTQMAASYTRVTIRGVACYRKFASPDQIQIVVAGGTAGKFSAVIGSWATGPRGSQRVTYPV
jgi:peroxiredoxin